MRTCSATWHQAHQISEQFLAQRGETINRTQKALEQLAENWTALQKLEAHPNTPYAQEILDGLSPHARALTTPPDHAGLTPQSHRARAPSAGPGAMLTLRRSGRSNT
ncbi:hypothetical protein OG883_01345 [Streptomyces sp. NBC_01142]|uniref:hypothetical protein n=1 Tax=Streptomyces sp. NBC_01142 TaxID=2975865 RepID=UPI00224E39E2|nr:hypothetical protein [Streptomyces sp. NBC_01142]MCX4818572.1 hypothetical protein [Streptomyces sp. NBC_01142]